MIVLIDIIYDMLFSQIIYILYTTCTLRCSEQFVLLSIWVYSVCINSPCSIFAEYAISSWYCNKHKDNDPSNGVW